MNNPGVLQTQSQGKRIFLFSSMIIDMMMAMIMMMIITYKSRREPTWFTFFLARNIFDDKSLPRVFDESNSWLVARKMMRQQKFRRWRSFPLPDPLNIVSLPFSGQQGRIIFGCCRTIEPLQHIFTKSFRCQEDYLDNSMLCNFPWRRRPVSAWFPMPNAGWSFTRFIC